MISLTILAIIVIGGLRSIYGTFLGALVVYAMPDLVLKRIPVLGDINGLPYVFSGVLIILIILFYPKGVVNVFSDLKRLFAKLTASKSSAAKDEVPNDVG